MGFWFFLSVLVGGNMLLKAYKYKNMNNSQNRLGNIYIINLEAKIAELESDKKNIHQRLEQLEESVYFGEFDLNKKFHNLAYEEKKNS